MRKGIYAILDTVANDIGGQLLMLPNPTTAIRTFADIAQAKGTTVNAHVDDYVLIELAQIDTETGLITPHPEPEVILTGKAWLASAQQVPTSTPELLK